MMSLDSLSYVDLASEMSYQEKHSDNALFNLNQVSYNVAEELVITEEQEHEEDDHTFSQEVQGAKRFQEDDIGLRIDSHQRRSFAQKYLFKSESKAQFEQDYMSEDAEEYSNE